MSSGLLSSASPNQRHARGESRESHCVDRQGRGLVAAGSAYAPVTYKGVTYVIAHINNAMLCPGLALGVIVSRASCITGGMIAAAASAVFSLVTVRQPGASLLPQADDLRSVSVTVAAAVAEVAARLRRFGKSEVREYRPAGTRHYVGAQYRRLIVSRKRASYFT